MPLALNAGITNSATSITLASGQGARFPTLSTDDYFYATLIDTVNNLEIVKCTARAVTFLLLLEVKITQLLGLFLSEIALNFVLQRQR